MSKLEATRGFWIGLGVALVIVALDLPIMLNREPSAEVECIRHSGEWRADSRDPLWAKYCHQPKDQK